MAKKDTEVAGRPLYDNVLIEPVEAEKVLAGTNLLLPKQTTDQDNKMLGKVIKINKEPWYDKDKKVEPHIPFKEGDIVLYRKWSATDLTQGDKKLIVCNLKDIVYVL